MSSPFLMCGFYGEGSTDFAFHNVLMRRLIELIVLDRSALLVRVGMQDLRQFSEARPANLEDRICEAALAHGGLNLIFLHQDGEGDPDSCRIFRIDPARLALARDAPLCPLVAVMPVRETESWALVDGDALRGAFGSSLSDLELGVPRKPQEVERIRDPKQQLQKALDKSFGGRKSRRRPKSARYFGQIAEYVDLAKLRAVPAFRRTEEDLVKALTDMNLFRK